MSAAYEDKISFVHSSTISSELNNGVVQFSPSAPPETEVYRTAFNYPIKRLRNIRDVTMKRRVLDVKFDISDAYIYIRTDEDCPIRKYSFAGDLLRSFGKQPSVPYGGICFDTKRDLLVSVAGDCVTRTTRLGANPGMSYNVYMHVEKASRCNSIAYLPVKDKYVLNDVDQNCVFIVDAASGDVTTRIDRDYNTGKVFQKISPVVSASLALTGAVIAISDSFKHCVKLFSSKGKLLGVYGSYGDREGNLINPRGLHVDTKGRVVVCDSSNKRVVRFSPHREIVKWECIISPEQLGFRRPCCIDISGDGHVVVSTMASSDSLCAWILFEGYC